MKTSRMQLICTLMVVGLVAVAYTGLTANQAGWTAQIGAGVCNYENAGPWPPGVPPLCNPNCVNHECPSTEDQGVHGFCGHTNVDTGFRDKGTELSNHREKTIRDCPLAVAPKPNADGDVCACGDNRFYRHEGVYLRKCVLSPC